VHLVKLNTVQAEGHQLLVGDSAREHFFVVKYLVLRCFMLRCFDQHFNEGADVVLGHHQVKGFVESRIDSLQVNAVKVESRADFDFLVTQLL
jgi:hypothetical protein